MSHEVSTSVDVRPPPVPRLSGGWDLRTAVPESADLTVIQDWMSRPHVERFWRQAWSAERWRTEWETQLAGGHARPCFVSRDGSDVVYLEIYRPALDALAAHTPTDSGDIGLHVAIGDADLTGRGIVRTLLPILTSALFMADPTCQRVLLEPDVHNTAAIKAFAAGGFTAVAELALPDKKAALMVRTRNQEGS